MAIGKHRLRPESGHRECARRAEWRFLPGKSPGRLSPYYQLRCDSGSPLIASFGSEEWSEPLYFCETHAKEFQSCAAFCKSAAAGAARRKENERPRETEAAPDGAGGCQAAPAAAVQCRETALAAECAAETYAALGRQIRQLGARREAVVSESRSTLDLGGLIDACLEQAMVEIIGDGAMSDAQKDGLIARLGELQKALLQSSGRRASLLEAHRIHRSLEGLLSADFGIEEGLKPAYRALHDGLEAAIFAALSERTPQPAGA